VRIKVDQIAIGSCTNSSYADLMILATILAGKRVHPDVSLVLSPGSSNIMAMIAQNGALGTLISAGARVLESSCGPCIGMGQAPKSDGISLRTFNRNFKGRSGTMNSSVYLVSTETAAVSAITGYFTDPRTFGDALVIEAPERYENQDNYYIYPPTDDEIRRNTEIFLGPNIQPFPTNTALVETMSQVIVLKTGDNITTDDICPSNAKLLPYRSNIPKLAEYCFTTLVSDFKERTVKYNGGIIIGGENYGQGSSREHAALLPLQLGIMAVIAKSFARIHKANLMNAGILPLEFLADGDYDALSEFDELVFTEITNGLALGRLKVLNKSKNTTFEVGFTGSERERQILAYGGYLNFAMSDEF
ncbi:MAG: aconitase family protein, partial [Culicoidibacterales bacterium]